MCKVLFIPEGLFPSKPLLQEKCALIDRQIPELKAQIEVLDLITKVSNLNHCLANCSRSPGPPNL